MKTKEPAGLIRTYMPINERLDRIGELLAKGVYLYLKKHEKINSDRLNEQKKAICEPCGQYYLDYQEKTLKN